MSITISNAYQESFDKNVSLIARQKESQLRYFVNEVHNNSESHSFPRLGLAEARTKTSARMASPAGGNGSGAVGSTDQIAWSDRRTLVATYDIGEIIEVEDPTQMMANPNDPITVALGSGMKNKIDDVIIEAATGTALDKAGNANTLPSSQILGDGSGIMSLSVLHDINTTFAEANVDPDEDRILVISPLMAQALMNEDKVINADYRTTSALSSGRLSSFMGFSDIIVSNRLTTATAGAKYALSFTRSSIGLHFSKDIWSKVAELPSMSFAWQFYSAMTCDAVRIEDEKVVVVDCKDAASA